MKTIDQELSEFILSGQSPKSASGNGARIGHKTASTSLYAARNAELILDHFGMGGLFWPTLQDLADAYEGLGTRERARQIIKTKYQQRLNGQVLPTAAATAKLLESRPIWTESDFLVRLEHAGFAQKLDAAKPLLNYLKTQGLADDYGVYREDLKPATRDSALEYSDRLIITKPLKARLQQAYTEARGGVGLNGLCRMSNVVPPEENEFGDQLQSVFKLHKDIVCFENQGETWFAFDDRDNSLVNYAEKTFFLVETCSIDNLSKILETALRSRTSPYGEFPDASVISRWIKNSRHFEITGNSARLMGDPTPLTDVENTLVEIMKGKGTFNSVELRAKLTEFGFQPATISKKVFHSPLVFVDKTRGRRKYQFTLVTDLEPPSSQENSADRSPDQDLHGADRYFAFKKRLQELETIDVPSSTKARREQGVLRNWLFADEDHSACAICGKVLAASSLVTAHKKKRSKCTANEKRDPYIVFPLCSFGCDYLYERGFITIVNGRVRSGIDAPGETELKVIEALSGKSIAARWARGPAAYFDNVPGKAPVEPASE